MALMLFTAGFGAGLVLHTAPRTRVTSEQLVARSHQPPPLRMLLAHNVPVLVAAGSGLVLIGFPSVAVISQVGYQAGRLWIDTQPLPGAVAAAATLPHGLPEVAAFVLASAAGLTGLWIAWASARGDFESTRALARQGCIWWLWSALLLFAAAGIERWMTPSLIRAVASTSALSRDPRHE